MDPEEYLRKHSIDALLDEMKQELVNNLPRDPLAFLLSFMEQKVKLNGHPAGYQEKSKSNAGCGVLKQRSHSDSTSFPSAQLYIHSGTKFISPSVQSRISLEKVKANSVLPEVGKLLPFGIDIGGSLTKTVVFEPSAELHPEAHERYIRELSFLKHSIKYGSTGERHPRLTFDWGTEGRFHFVSFESRRIEAAVKTMKENGLLVQDKIVFATGGGSQKYAELFKRELQVDLVKGDELSCLLVGINFVLENVKDECFYVENTDISTTCIKKPLKMQSDNIFPYVLVNIGSGVSILLVENELSFKRISGTTIGGGTYLGLCQLLANVSDFGEAMKLAEKGNHKNIDMLVGDIYGGDYDAFHLSAETVASSFGKAMGGDVKKENLSAADLSASLLRMIGINIAQLGYLCALRYDTPRIMFVGSFLRKNVLSLNALAYSINYWSNGTMRALFLRHEGHFGAMGAFLLQREMS